jgi:hypothetical protein
MLNVVEERRPAEYLASISYGFDRDDDDAGPYLDPLNRQCRYAEDLMRLVEEVVLSDLAYVARLKRHYALVKRAAIDPAHPAYETLRQATASDEGWMSVQALEDWAERLEKRTPGPEPERVGRNDPCPCGSGLKYKHCCGRRGGRR